MEQIWIRILRMDSELNSTMVSISEIFSNSNQAVSSDYIGQMLRAMHEDNVNVEGYTGWFC